MPRAESRFPGEAELAFRHALLREGAYAMLTDEDRALGRGPGGVTSFDAPVASEVRGPLLVA